MRRTKLYMATYIIGAIVALACVYGAYAYYRKLRYGGGCCGAKEPPEKKVRVKDRNPHHYPYSVILKVEGIVCANCTRRVENALNRLDGVWAHVDPGEKTALVRMKQETDVQQLRDALKQIGYTAYPVSYK